MSSTNQSEERENRGSGELKFVQPLYEFAGKLLVQLTSKQNEQQADNIIISPVCIQQGLGMVLLGADAGSQTKQELQDTIGYGSMSDSELEQCHEDYARIMADFERITKEARDIETAANRATVNRPHYPHERGSLTRSTVINLFSMLVTRKIGRVRPEYERDISKYYRASIGEIDDEKPEATSEMLAKVNNWAKEAGFDGPILDERYLADILTLLVTTIRLEAFWTKDFEEIDGERIFYNYGAKDKPVDGKLLVVKSMSGSRLLEFTSSERAQVKFLHEHMSKDASFKRLSRCNFRAIKIPLKEGVSFVIFEPVIDGATDGCTSSTLSRGTSSIAQLSKLIDDLFAVDEDDKDSPKTKLASALDLLDGCAECDDNQLDYFRMPKFKFESDIDLKPTLESIGLELAFDRSRAEIYNILEGVNRFSINRIKHMAVIETTETGIKAAGANMIVCDNLLVMDDTAKINVTIENPFMFVIRYQQLPLFVGQLTHL